MKLECFRTQHTKIKQKWIKYLNRSPVTIKFLDKNIGRTLSNINYSKISYDPPSRLLEIKKKINRWDIIKLKSLLTMKETIGKMKIQSSEWEKIIAKKTTDKRNNLQNIQASHIAQYQKKE